MILLAALVCFSCTVLVAYPYLIYPLVLRRLRKVPVRKTPVDLSASLLFCAFNESKALPDKIANLRALKSARPDLQILAYDDGSTDGTAELLDAAGDWLTVIHGPGRTGKAAGMKLLLEQASGDILIFTDADVILAQDAIERMMPYFGDPTIGGVCGVLRCARGGASVTAQVGSAYWRLDEKLRALESETGNVMGAWGSIFSVRRALYPTFPNTVLDDLTVSMSVIFQGHRLVRAADVIAFHESVADRSEELRRKMRIGARAYHTHVYLRPQLRQMAPIDRFKYVSRKQIRWFGGLFMAVGALSGIGVIAALSPIAAVAMTLICFVIAFAAWKASRGYLAKVNEILLATFATLAGVLKAMRGQTVTTWAPAATRQR